MIHLMKEYHYVDGDVSTSWVDPQYNLNYTFEKSFDTWNNSLKEIIIRPATLAEEAKLGLK